MEGFLVTWDVNSKDRAQCVRVRRFVYGRKEKVNGEERQYGGFVHRRDVEYVGQSTIFVAKGGLDELRQFLLGNSVSHVVKEAWIGETVS